MVVPQTASSAGVKPRAAHAKKKARAHAKAEARRQQEADKVVAMPVTNHRAAGIDIGDRSHWVCVGFTTDDVSELIKEVPTHTEGLRQILAYLRKACGARNTTVRAACQGSKPPVGSPSAA